MSSTGAQLEEARIEQARLEQARLEEARLELEVAARRLGIEIPADLQAGVLHGYQGLRELCALLRRAGPPDENGASGA